MAQARRLELHQKAVTEFAARNPASKTIYDTATRSLPGGNTRSVLFYHPFPVSITKAAGSRLHDADGHEYVDLLGEYTAGLYGHSEPAIVEAILQATKRGLNFGGQHEDEAKLAALVQERFPSMDLLRFTNSGTEATLMALAAAKAFTGKQKVMVFAGAYHGGAFTFVSGASSPVNAPHPYVIARYNDLTSVRALLRESGNARDLAAIIVEPMLGSGGAIPADRVFLEGLRRMATECGAVLIFDEVMTSRFHRGGGAQSQLAAGSRPDLTTLGKYIGGGMSFGAFGGKRAIMEQFDPRRPNALAHAGTFNNNVLTMLAGRTGLEKVFTPRRAEMLHSSGEELRKRLQSAAEGTLMKITGCGSIMAFCFTETELGDIKSPMDVGSEHNILGDLLHLFLLQRGYYIARRGFLALSLALSDEELDGFLGAVRAFISEHRPLLQRREANAKL